MWPSLRFHLYTKVLFIMLWFSIVKISILFYFYTLTCRQWGEHLVDFKRKKSYLKQFLCQIPVLVSNADSSSTVLMVWLDRHGRMISVLLISVLWVTLVSYTYLKDRVIAESLHFKLNQYFGICRKGIASLPQHSMLKNIRQSVYWRSHEEVRQGYAVRAGSHDDTAGSDQPGTMELSAKIAHKGYHQQVAWGGEVWQNE